MSTSIFILLVVQIILIILNAIFASAEIAVLSMNETKLERMAEQGNGRAKRLVRLTQEPARFLATIQVAITLSGFLGSAFAADNFSEPLVDWVVGMGVNIPRSTLDTIAVILIATVYKGNIIKNLIMDCQSYTKYRPNETTGGIFVSWRRKEELPTGA